MSLVRNASSLGALLVLAACGGKSLTGTVTYTVVSDATGEAWCDMDFALEGTPLYVQDCDLEFAVVLHSELTREEGTDCGDIWFGTPPIESFAGRDDDDPFFMAYGRCWGATYDGPEDFLGLLVGYDAFGDELWGPFSTRASATASYEGGTLAWSDTFAEGYTDDPPACAADEAGSTDTEVPTGSWSTGEGGVPCETDLADVWTFEAVGGGRAQLRVDTLEEEADPEEIVSLTDPDVYIIGPDGCLVEDVAAGMDCATDAGTGFYNACPSYAFDTVAGTYTVRVETALCSSPIGGYVLSVDTGGDERLVQVEDDVAAWEVLPGTATVTGAATVE